MRWMRILLSAAAVLALALPAGGSATSGTRGVAVYLVRGEQVVPVRRYVPRAQGVARAALAALFWGPTRAELRAGYSTAIPRGTHVNGVSLHDGVATVDLT